MKSVKEIGERLVELCREGKNRQAVDELYSEDIVSVEPEGSPREYKGLAEIGGKHDWFDKTFETRGIKVDGPWVNEPCFVVKFDMDCVNRADGSPTPMTEYAVYTCEEGKIVHERFF